ncbi:MAG TPA: LysR family transcriptional regulator [Chloroflexia bacterium]|nr:LysR family transcriptional regulator [Chloroflexia bacterium]
MINLWQVQVFLVVAETGSFSAAAVRLHLTQPGVSQQIRSLETHLGTKLFIRRGHGVELTAAGYDLLDPARRLIHLSEATERTVMSRRSEVSGRIRLGCCVSSAPYTMGNWLYEFRSKFPEVSVQLEHTEPGPMIGALRAQELDGGFVLGRMRGRGLVHHKIIEDPITLIVPLNHAWTSPAEIGRAELELQALGREERHGTTAATHAAPSSSSGGGRTPRYGEDGWVPAIKPALLKTQHLIVEHGNGESHSDARRALNDALEERGLTIRDMHVVLELPDPTAVACAVAEGLGVGLVPLSIARRFVGQVFPLRIEGFSLAQHVYLIHDRKALHSPAVSAWWKFVDGKVAKPSHAESKGESNEREEIAAPVEMAASLV